jgi:hypothetical protein
MFYALRGGPNQLDLYRWTTDCSTPTLAGHYSFGGRLPHELYLWQDPAQPSRVLLYVALFGSAGEGLEVVDISDPARPVRVSGLTIPRGYGRAPVHSVSLSADGRTAYLSLWTGGLVAADVSDVAAGQAGAAVRLLTPPGSAYTTPPGNVHSAIPLRGTSLVLTTDERYPPPFGQGCPFGTAHLVDVADPARPAVTAVLAVPENDPRVCATAPRGTWTSHNATLTAHLALISWYSAGLQAFQLDDPANPVRLAELRPSGTNPTARDLELGTTDAMTWSYPVISQGLVYIADINQGLLILRYRGPHEEEISSLAFSEGNSNLTATVKIPEASPAPSPAPTVAPTPSPSLPATPSPRARSRAAGDVPAAVLVSAGATLLLALLLGVLLAVRHSRGNRAP